jgi:N-acetylglucosaminyldiphosphoundecaprenol N-acetyl-beta-D-mannosaminyltransferase
MSSRCHWRYSKKMETIAVLRRIQIAHTSITPISVNVLHDFINAALKGTKKRLFFAMNIHIFCELYKDPLFNKKHDRADVIFIDGVPLLWFTRLLRRHVLNRISGTDLVEWILRTQKKVFLVGPPNKTVSILKEKFPSAICGSYSPPFGVLWTDDVDKQIIKASNKSKATIILVGVGPFKQERWLLNNLSKTNAVLGIGVGSAFDILSGKIPRAPKILCDNGFEWMWRIMKEPRRLFPRYLRDILFLAYIFSREPHFNK